VSRILCTFSGRYGDIVWSLPTAREISQRHGEKVDFAIMPQYKSLLPLLQAQPYIDFAFVLDDWVCTGSPFGDQPWEAPWKPGYEKTYHLTYRQHPHGMCCANFIAWQQGMEFKGNVVPFITVPEVIRQKAESCIPPSVCYSFNEMYKTEKAQFLASLMDRIGNNVLWLNVAEMPWLAAAKAIQDSGIFVGCRSANWVMAIGLGAQTITYEPHPARNKTGQFGGVFSGPQGSWEAFTPCNTPPVEAARHAESVIKAILRGKKVA
jgi:hypothetical protein